MRRTIHRISFVDFYIRVLVSASSCAYFTCERCCPTRAAMTRKTNSEMTLTHTRAPVYTEHTTTTLATTTSTVNATPTDKPKQRRKQMQSKTAKQTCASRSMRIIKIEKYIFSWLFSVELVRRKRVLLFHRFSCKTIYECIFWCMGACDRVACRYLIYFLFICTK